FEQKRNHVALAVQCYMKQHNVPEEKACEELKRQLEDAWRDLNQELRQPTPLPMCLMKVIQAFSHILYKGEDGFTTITERMKNNIDMVFFNPILV
ncbi:hypothetical protein Ancab_026163, partial [Ancistrocladus abbreviatus]